METQEILEKLNENSKECIIKNRRKGPDFWLQFINLVGLIIWGAWLSLFALCENAGVKIFNIMQPIEEVKNVELLNVAVTMAIVMFFISAGLLIISFRRTRRRDDKIKISLLVSEVISFIVGILLLIKIY
jgi:heme/copper-type cytochrome/quinol oxidase subunit 2